MSDGVTITEEQELVVQLRRRDRGVHEEVLVSYVLGPQQLSNSNSKHYSWAAGETRFAFTLTGVEVWLPEPEPVLDDDVDVQHFKCETCDEDEDEDDEDDQG